MARSHLPKHPPHPLWVLTIWLSSVCSSYKKPIGIFKPPKMQWLPSVILKALFKLCHHQESRHHPQAITIITTRIIMPCSPCKNSTINSSSSNNSSTISNSSSNNNNNNNNNNNLTGEGIITTSLSTSTTISFDNEAEMKENVDIVPILSTPTTFSSPSFRSFVVIPDFITLMENFGEESALMQAHIFPFIGKGHYRFIAAVSPRMKYLYEYYLKQLQQQEQLEQQQQQQQYEEQRDDNDDDDDNDQYRNYNSNRSNNKNKKDDSWKTTFGSHTFGSTSRTRLYVGDMQSQQEINNSNAQARQRQQQSYPNKLCRYVALHGGTLEFIQSLHLQEGYCLDENAPQQQQQQGQQQTGGVKKCEDFCYYAARGGNLKVLKWIAAAAIDNSDQHHHHTPWDSRVFDGAAWGGHLETLKWLHRHHHSDSSASHVCSPDHWTCSYAAWGGHLEVLQYLRLKMKCDWNSRVCALAAGHGHLQILQWARSHGCRWVKQECLKEAMQQQQRQRRRQKQHQQQYNGYNHNNEDSTAVTTTTTTDLIEWIKMN
mmetsp:Transcript_8744/g.12719  ORF Transcript_8744/g.12719 Transcript_8744/m.12719 type:complete len:542 (-) Transcript_8744:123-1748(-)